MMMKIENFVSDAVLRSAEALYGRLEEGQLQIPSAVSSRPSTSRDTLVP